MTVQKPWTSEDYKNMANVIECNNNKTRAATPLMTAAIAMTVTLEATATAPHQHKQIQQQQQQ